MQYTFECAILFQLYEPRLLLFAQVSGLSKLVDLFEQFKVGPLVRVQKLVLSVIWTAFIDMKLSV